MKRADHHNTTPIAPLEESLDTIGNRQDDLESEQVVPHHTPSMGALPADKPGSMHQQSFDNGVSDEFHARETEDEISESSKNEEEIIAVGTGPDPENIDD